MTGPVPTSTAQNPALGTVLVLVSAVLLGCTPSLARFAYDHGTNAETAALVRCLSGLVIGGGVAWLLRRPVALTRTTLRDGAWLGGILALQTFGYLASVNFIPVSVAIVVFFLFPVFVTLLLSVVERVRFGVPTWIAVALAFLGVTLTTGGAARGLDPVGIGLALGAAVATAIYIVYGRRVSAQIGPLRFVAVSFGGAFVFFALYGIGTGGIAWPDAVQGWAGLAAASLCNVCGLLVFFAALGMMPPVRATLLTNTEPLFGIVVAWVLLGELLAAVQYLGAALVIGAVLLPDLVRLTGRRRAAPVPKI